ncbi:transposase [Lichenicoccus roseus]|uniref:Transposase n=1 Tax=Lichenicoccus roseus TaxID=2683649 RepID=A0A5R9J198_9PROT|nr:transposase [Lichenicoccus roseus]
MSNCSSSRLGSGPSSRIPTAEVCGSLPALGGKPGMVTEFWLSDRQWKQLAPLLPRESRGVPRVDDRRVISGIVHVLKSGGRWADAPAIYGLRKTLYNRFVRSGAAGIWQCLFETLTTAGGPPAELLLDSTYIKAHRCAAGGKGGARSRPSASAAAAARPRSLP